WKNVDRGMPLVEKCIEAGSQAGRDSDAEA
ncbi:MAG TPA: Inorganic pyrophosphatase, partial [Cyanobacteria bacterium UBA8543]|nr:Inorganic pyrophosphatase [Cyanobacteria bacterium UBA8543]